MVARVTADTTTTAATATADTSAQASITVRPEVRGDLSVRLPACINQEVCAEGAAGTGKTRAILEYLHMLLLHPGFAGARVLVARKTHVDLAGSAMQTYQQEVLRPEDGVRYFGGNRIDPPAFIYPSGARLLMSGLDKPDKIKSKAFNIAFINEATECGPDDAEMVRSRLGRDDRMPFWQLIYDANPAAPTHWLNQRMNAGLCARLRTYHRDNPAYWDAAAQAWTAIGRRYVEETLAGLTGVRYQRLALGVWAAAEGTVYEDAWHTARNLRPRAEYCINTTTLRGNCGIPPAWPRYLALDFGYTNPFVCQWWAEDPDGRLILYREIYRTRRLVSEHCADILRWAGWERGIDGRLKMTDAHADPLPRVVYGDPAGGEAKAQIAAHLGLRVTDANNDIQTGIQAVAARMKPAGDGRPRLVILEGARVDRDQELADKKKPTCTAEEVDGYVWDTAGGQQRGERPAKENDHGVDAMRYLCASRDLKPTTLRVGPRIW